MASLVALAGKPHAISQPESVFRVGGHALSRVRINTARNIRHVIGTATLNQRAFVACLVSGERIILIFAKSKIGVVLFVR